jgi:hypothetical protein
VKIFKGIGLGLVGFFLFVSLPILSIFINLNNTLLNPDFVVREIEKLNVTEVAREYVKNQIFPEDLPYFDAIDTTLAQEKTWIDQQIKYVIANSYDYLLGTSNMLSFTFYLEEIKQNFSDNLVNSIQKSPPPEYKNLSFQEKEQFILDLKQQIQEETPSSYDLEINQDIVGYESMKAIQLAKEIIGDFKVTYWILIIVVLLMILLIGLIQREVRGIVRALGIIFALDGILCGITYLILRLVIPTTIPIGELPMSVEIWLKVLTNDLISPIGVFGLVVLVMGALCLAASFFIKGKQVVATE